MQRDESGTTSLAADRAGLPGRGPRVEMLLTDRRLHKTVWMPILAGALGALAWWLQAGESPTPPVGPVQAAALPGAHPPGRAPAAPAPHDARRDNARPGGDDPSPPQAPAQPPVQAPDSPLWRQVQSALRDAAGSSALHTAQAMELCAIHLKQAQRMADQGLRGRRWVDIRPTPGTAEAAMLEPHGATDDQMAAAMESFEREVGRCEVLDARTLARRGELYARAWRDGVTGAAHAYLACLTQPDQPNQAEPALLDELRAVVRQEAGAGGIVALSGWADISQQQALQAGFSAVEHWAYREAYWLIMERNSPGSTASLRTLQAQADETARLAGMAPVALSAAQHAQARALAQQVVDAHFKKQLRAAVDHPGLRRRQI